MGDLGPGTVVLLPDVVEGSIVGEGAAVITDTTVDNHGGAVSVHPSDMVHSSGRQDCGEGRFRVPAVDSNIVQIHLVGGGAERAAREIVTAKEFVVLLTTEDDETLHGAVIDDGVFRDVSNRCVDCGGVGVTGEFSGVV